MRLWNFDANATYGLKSEVADELQPIIRELRAGRILNPSSVHQGGQRAKLILDAARDAVRELAGASSRANIVFTSGASEANNWIVTAPFFGALAKTDSSEPAIVVSAIEHHSVLEPVERLAKLGVPTALLRPDAYGWWHDSKVRETVAPSTRLFSCMLANNETGELLPVAELARAARSVSQEIFIHTDAVQGAGKVPLHFEGLGVDAMTISGHKIGGLAGTGAVIMTGERDTAPLLLGGVQEGRMRAGTENILGIAALGFAAKLALKNLEQLHVAMERNRDAARDVIAEKIPSARILREALPHLPNTLSVHIPGVRADDLVVAADLHGICISSGAACASGKQLPSHVLLALGFSEQVARETVRISFRAEDSASTVEEGIKILASLAAQRKEGEWNALR